MMDISVIGRRDANTGRTLVSKVAFACLLTLAISLLSIQSSSPFGAKSVDASLAVPVAESGSQEDNSTTPVVLVSNYWPGGTVGGTDLSEQVAQVFTTGTNENGYILTSITVEFRSNVVIGDVATAELWSVSSDSPSAKIADLTKPSALTDVEAGGTVIRQRAEFTAPADTNLTKETDYALVLKGVSPSGRVNTAGSNAEDSGKSAGWSIADNSHWKSASDDWSDATSFSGSVQIGVKGYDTPNSDASLSTLVVRNAANSAITMHPSFSKTHYNYQVFPPSADEIATIQPSPTDSNATWEVQDEEDNVLTDASTSSGFQVNLTQDAHIFKVVVTGEGATSTQTYTLSLLKPAKMIGNIGSAGSLRQNIGTEFRVQVFTTGSEDVPYYALASIEVYVSGFETGAELEGASLWSVADSKPSAKIADLIKPSSSLNFGRHSYTAPANTHLTPSTEYAFVTHLSSNSNSIRVVGNDKVDSGKQRGWSITDGHLYTGSLSLLTTDPQEADSELAIDIKAARGGPETSTSLAALDVIDTLDDNIEFILTPEFESDTTEYVVSMVNAVTQIKVSPIIGDARGSVEIVDENGDTITDANDTDEGLQVALDVGENTIKVVVTSGDGNHERTYTIVARRDYPRTPEILVASGTSGSTGEAHTQLHIVQVFQTGPHARGYTLSSLDLAYHQAPTNSNYEVSIWSTSNNLRDEKLYTLANPSSFSADENTFTASSGAYLAPDTLYAINVKGISLATGGGELYTIEAGARRQDKLRGWDIPRPFYFHGSYTSLQRLKLAIKGTYNNASPDADLESLEIIGRALSPSFSPGRTSYAAETFDSEITLRATPSFAGATVEILDEDDNALADADDSTPGFQVSVGTGDDTTIKVKVRSEEGSNTETYTVVVNKVAPNASLTLVSNTDETARTNPANLAEERQRRQEFVTGTNSGGYVLDKVVVDFAAMIDIPAISLYEIDGSDAALVANLTSPDSAATGEVDYTAPADTSLKANTTYQVRIGTTSGITTVNVTASDDQDGYVGWSIANSHGVFNTGTATETTNAAPLQIEVHGKFSESSVDATLSSLALSDGTLDPEFSDSTHTYTAAVPNDVEQVTVTYETNHDNAEAEVLDGSDMTLADADDGTDHHQVDLAVGENVFKVKVTAENESVTLTYQVTVTRRAAPARITSTAFTSDPGSDRIYRTDDVIEATLTFDKDIVVDTTGGTPQAQGIRPQEDFFGTDTDFLQFVYSPTESASNTMVFTLTVTDDIIHDKPHSRLGIYGNSGVLPTLDLMGATVVNADDGEVPANLDFEIFNHSGAIEINPRVRLSELVYENTLTGGRTIHTVGDSIRLVATFEENVTVTDTNGPYVVLSHPSAGHIGNAVYKSGSGTNTLVFEYDVQKGDYADPDRPINIRDNHTSGIYASGRGFDDPDGDIIDSRNTRVIFKHDRAPLNNLKLDARGPQVESAAINGKALTVVWDEEPDATSIPDKSAFTLNYDEADSDDKGTVPISSLTRSGKTWTFTLEASVLSGDTVTLDYEKPATNPLKDSAGNETDSFDEQAVTNNTTATATINITTDSNTPLYASEDGTPATIMFTLSRQVRAFILYANPAISGGASLDDVQYYLVDHHPTETVPDPNDPMETIEVDVDIGVEIPVPQNVSTFQVNVIAVNDSETNEGADEAIRVTLDPPDGVDKGSSQISPLIYLVDDHVAVEWADDSPTEVAEGKTIGVKLVASYRPHYRSDDREEWDIGIVTSNRTAKEYADYEPPTATLTFFTGNFSIDSDCNCYLAKNTVSIRTLQDTLLEGDETFTTKLLRAAGLHNNWILTSETQTITIDDDDMLDWELSLSSGGIVEVAESAAKLTIDTGGVTFTGAQTITLTIGGIATLTTDYTVSPADVDADTPGHQVTLPANARKVDITFTAVDDTTDDPNETITIDVAHGSDTIGSQQTITVIEGGLVELSTSATSVAEDGGSVSYTITATTAEDEQPTSDFELEISVSSADDTASAGDDYTAHSRAITFTRSDFSRQDISTDSSGDYRWVATDSAERIAISEDTLIEGDETFDLNLGAIDATTGFGAGQGTLTFTIEDNDEPDWTRSLDRKTIAESTTSAAKITIDQGSATFQRDQTIKLTLSGTASSADYTISPSDVSTDEGHQVTFPAGADTLVVTFTAVSDTDTAEDFTETILVDLSHDGSAIGERVSIKLTRKGLIGFKTRATIEGSESDGSFAYTVRAVTADDTQPATGYTASIKVSTVDDTATAGEDFTRLFKHVITFNRSDFSRQDTGGGDYRWVAEHTRSVAVIDDNIVEEDEQFRLLLSGEQPEADFKINFGSALLNIENDDEVDWVLSLSSRGIVEVAESAAKLTISTGGVAFSENKTFTLTIGGTAAQGTDYTVSPADAVSGTTGHQVVLEDGEEEVVVTFTAVDDTADDPNETITIDVALGSDTIGSQQTITVIEGGLVELSTSATSVAEDGGSISYTITATTAEDERPASDFELDISVSSADDTASAGDDYTTHSRAITFTRSDFSRQDISTDSSGDNRWVATDSAERIAISEDTLIEGDETFDLNLGAIDATTGFGAGQGTLTFTIEDDDEPDWTRSLDRKTIAEPTQSSAVITIDVGSVTFQHDQTIKLTLSGTASSGDYTIAPSDVSTDDGHQVTFPAGAQNMKVTFTAVLDTDTTEDFTETILVDLSHDGSAIGERVSIKLTDKGYFTLTKATIKRSESDGSFDYTIKAVTADDTQPATGYTASIKISTADGTATAGEDFTRLFNHRITFNRSDFSRKDIGGGDYRWVAEHTGSVAVIDDNIVEEDEELRLALFGEQPEADFKRDRDTTALTIRNDDIVSFSAVPSAKSISERASGASRVTISTGGVAFSDDKTFTLTIGGTAAQGTDYTVSPADAVSGTTGHQVVLEDGEEEVVVTFTAVNDTVDDPNETITVSVTLGGDAIGEAFTITVTEGGTVEILASTTTVRERFDGIMLYTIRATTGDDVRPAHNFTLAVTVNTADGTAVAGEDYTAHSATITLVRNDFLKLETSEGSGDYRWIATAERTFDIANDAVVEPDETFTIDVKDLDADTGFGVTEGRLDMTLVSDDRWALKAEASPTHIAEGDTEDVTLTVTTVNQDGETNSDDSCITPFAIDAEVDIADSGPQNAGAGTDYTYTEESENLHHLRLDSCESHGTVSLRIAATADDVDEGDERIVLTPGPYTSQDTSLYDGRWGEEAVVRIVDSTTRPQTTITLETVSPSDPEETTLTDGTAIGKFTIRVRFSEPVSDFTEGDIEWKTIANSTYDGVSISLRASNLIETVSQREYAIALVPNRSGVLVILIPGGAATSVAEDNGSKVKSVTVRIDMSANPAFSREVTENAAAGTALGGPVRFTDPPAGIDTYSLSGLDADRNAFTIDASTGQLRTKSGVTYDHETKNTYRVMVSGHSSADPMTRASVEVTIFVVADQLPPLAPGRPSVSKGTETNLDVSWSAPDNSGRPAISGYRTRYRVSPSGSWQSGPPTTGSTGAILTGLSATTRYDVQAQATNSAGDGPWSDSGSATTGSNIVNPPPPQDPTDPRIIVSSTAITVNEGNSGGQTYTVRLASKPSGNVTVTISGHAGTDLTVSSTSIPFSTTTWNSARAVRVTASHDGDTTNDSASLAHRGAGGGYDAASATVAVTVRDDDTANSPATGSPIITGVTSPLTVGTTLAASTSSIADSDGLTNPSYRYQWRRSRSDISGATGSTYTVRQADVGHTISVRVSFRDDSGHQESLASGPTAAVSDGEQNNDLPTLTLYADVTSISEGDFSRMRIDRAGSTTDRIETGLTCYDSGTDDTVLVAAIIGAGETSETTTAMHALDTSDSKTDRTITCRLNTAFNSVHNIGSPSSATVSVRD